MNNKHNQADESIKINKANLEKQIIENAKTGVRNIEVITRHTYTLNADDMTQIHSYKYLNVVITTKKTKKYIYKNEIETFLKFLKKILAK